MALILAYSTRTNDTETNDDIIFYIERADGGNILHIHSTVLLDLDRVIIHTNLTNGKQTGKNLWGNLQYQQLTKKNNNGPLQSYYSMQYITQLLLLLKEVDDIILLII